MEQSFSRRSRAGRRLRPDGRPVAILALALTSAAFVGAPFAGACDLDAQGVHLHRPVPEIEVHLRDLPFDILEWRGSRMPGDRTQHVVLRFEDESIIRVKWANAPPGGGAFNNEPRYEAAAYEIQKLFLDPDEYVVPPTVLRAFPLDYVDAQIPGTPRTFREAESVLVALQYWLYNVTSDGFWDPERAQQDTLYARHIGNMNTLTHLIRHNDSNVGNFLISNWEGGDPRVFSVDNGVAFRAPNSDRGYEWRDLQVRRLAARTVDRLREITEDDLTRTLGILAEYHVVDGFLVPVTPGENISPNRGVRRRDGRVQLGLTRGEIRDIDRRRQALLRRIERGQIETF
jgi:hypothetical protein